VVAIELTEPHPPKLVLIAMTPTRAVFWQQKLIGGVMRAFFCGLALVLVAGCVNIYGQPPQSSPTAKQAGDANITPNGVIGEVRSIDAAARQMVVKTDAGALVTVNLNDKTAYKRLAPGEKTLTNATSITFADVGEGDRVWARGKVAEDHKSVPALAVIVMTKADIAKKQEADRAEWRRRGILGVVSTVKSDTKEITISTTTPAGTQPIIIPVTDKVDLRRYAPDSIKFSDAKSSSLTELQVGDQLRALGEKSADGTHFTPEKIVTGSFRTVAGTVTAIDAAAGEIKINDLQTKKPLTVVIKSDSVLRKFEMGGGMMGGGMTGAGRGPGGGQGGGGGQAAPAQGGKPPQGSAPEGNKQPQPAGGAPGGAGSGPGGQGGGPRPGGRNFNIQDMLDRMPTIAIADLKVGDTIIVSSTKGADPSRLTAISLVNGADTLLTMLAPRPAQGAQGPPNPAAGLGTGVTFGIGLP
jgi:hypothetical protein